MAQTTTVDLLKNESHALANISLLASLQKLSTAALMKSISPACPPCTVIPPRMMRLTRNVTAKVMDSGAYN